MQKKFTKSPGIAAGSDSGRPSPLADSCNRRKLAVWARSRAADCREPLMIERSPAASECGFAPCPPAAKRQSLHLRSDSQGAGAAARHIGPGHRCAPAGRRRGGWQELWGTPPGPRRQSLPPTATLRPQRSGRRAHPGLSALDTAVARQSPTASKYGTVALGAGRPNGAAALSHGAAPRSDGCPNSIKRARSVH